MAAALASARSRLSARRDGNLSSAYAAPTCKLADAIWSEPPRRSRPASPSRWASSPGSPTTTAGPGTPDGPERLPRRSTRTAGSACAENPVRLLQEADAERAGRRRRATPAARRAPRRSRSACSADLARPRRDDGRRRPTRPIAYFSAEYGVHGSLPDLLRRPRRARRRHPQGGLRPRAAARRGRPDVPPGLLPPAHRRRRLAARVLGRHRPGPPARRARHRRRRRAAHDHACRSRDDEVTAQIWRVDVGRVPLFLLDAERPENDQTAPLDHLAPLHRRRGHAPGPVHAARHRRRARARGDGDRARASCTSTRATRRSSRSSSRAATYSGDGSLSAALEIAPQAHDLHHPHAGPGRQRHLPGRSRSRRRSGTIAGTLGVDAEEIVRLGRTNPDEEAEPFGVTQFALRTSRAANGVSAAATARSRARCGTAMWPDRAGRRRADHPRDQRRAHPDLARPADARAARPPPRRGLAGPRDRPRDVGAGRRHPRRGAVGRPQRAARRADRLRARPRASLDRLGARRAARVRRGRRERSTPTC